MWLVIKLKCFVFYRFKYIKYTNYFSHKCSELALIRKIEKKERKKNEKFDRDKIFSLLHTLTSLKLSNEDLKKLYFKFREKEYNDLKYFVENFRKIKRFGLQYLIDLDALLVLALKKSKNVEDFIHIAKNFDNFKLYEDEQGDFKKLYSAIDVEVQQIKEIVDVMIDTKLYGAPLKQKDILRYFDSFRPESEDLEDLKNAWILAHKFNIKITIEDFIAVIKNHRKLTQFIKNYIFIKTFSLDIPLEEFKAWNYEQELITDTIKSLVEVYKNEIVIDINYVLKKMSLGVHMAHILHYLILFKHADFDISIVDLYKYGVAGGDFEALFETYLYNYKGTEPIVKHHLFEFLLHLQHFLHHHPIPPKTFLKAVEKAKKEFKTKSNGQEAEFEIVQKVFDDYIAGYDVFSILNIIQYARKHELNISYELAKLYYKSPWGLKGVVHRILSPVILEPEDGVKVTTKDNIEIFVKIYIEASLVEENYFNGTDVDVLFERVNTLFIEEIQKHYNHDEIIRNIEKISSNILKRLSGEKIKVLIKKGAFSVEEEKKFVEVSKWKPHKIIIPKIEFVKDTFKEIDKLNEEFEIEKKLKEIELEAKRAEIEVKKAWAKENNVKYLILKDEEEVSHAQHSSHSHASASQKKEIEHDKENIHNQKTNSEQKYKNDSHENHPKNNHHH